MNSVRNKLDQFYMVHNQLCQIEAKLWIDAIIGSDIKKLGFYMEQTSDPNLAFSI